MTTRPAPDAADLAGLDLADVRMHAEYDLATVWRHLRDSAPVHWNACPDSAPGGFWVVTRYADVVGVYRDPRRFSSARGNLLTALMQGGDSAAGRMIAVSDGPRHHAVRSLLAPMLGPRTLHRLREQVADTTTRLLGAAVQRGRCDFVAEVAAHIPLWTICDLLGVPEPDRPFLREQTSLALGSDSPTQSPAEVWVARNEILLYFRELARARRAQPADDLVSLLASARLDGEEVSEDEIILNCYSLILGGDETARMSMSGAVAAFAEHAGQWHRLRSGLVDLASAVEEVMRWTSPAMHAGRTVTQDVVLHGQHLRAGDIATVWNISANFDEREFDQPDRFDLGRSPNRQLSFGYGAHFCLGAALARIEMTALLDTLRSMVSAVEIDGPAQRIYSTFLAGYSSLPVAFTPARRTGRAGPG